MKTHHCLKSYASITPLKCLFCPSKVQFHFRNFSDSKNSTPEPESEDSQPKELDDEEKEQPLVLQPPTATTTSTLGKFRWVYLKYYRLSSSKRH